jgi:phage antirepressor YoqD-like protein
MNRDGFTLLTMGFNGKQALQFKLEYIGAFNKMEEALKRTTITALPDFTNPAEAARAWAEQYELKCIEQKRADEAESQILALTQEIETMQPKVSYYDNILANKSTVLTTQIAQDYGMSAKALNKTLNEMGIQRKVNDQWILYAQYLGMGYVQSKPVTITHANGQKSVKYNTEWTQKGRLFLYDELKKHDILPLIEIASHNPY